MRARPFTPRGYDHMQSSHIAAGSASVASNIPSVWKCFQSVHAARSILQPDTCTLDDEVLRENLCALVASRIASVCNVAIFHQAKERHLKHAVYTCTLHSHLITCRLTEVCTCIHTYLCAYSRVSARVGVAAGQTGRVTRQTDPPCWINIHLAARTHLRSKPNTAPRPPPHTHNPQCLFTRCSGAPDGVPGKRARFFPTAAIAVPSQPSTAARVFGQPTEPRPCTGGGAGDGRWPPEGSCLLLAGVRRLAAAGLFWPACALADGFNRFFPDIKGKKTTFDQWDLSVGALEKR